MLSYCYTWTPLVIVGTLSLLALPWLGLIALLVVVLGSLVLPAAFVTAIVWVPLNAGRRSSAGGTPGSGHVVGPTPPCHGPGPAGNRPDRSR